jgi:glycyl-tRNA synthetase beta chain
MNPLLLEIGTEEIPAGYIEPALEALADIVDRKLKEARIVHGTIKTYGTPRRLVLSVDALEDRQQAMTQEVLGPPERVAFDDKANPTLAAKKFAEKVGVPLSDLRVVDTNKGRYIAATITDKGIATRKILQKVLPEAILSIPFPKTMRWSDLKIAFARPIQSVAALLGKAVVPFVLDGSIKSGRYAWGHMFMQHKKIKIDHAQEYIEAMRQAQVIVDIKTRKEMVRKEIAKAAASLGGTILKDEALVDIVANLVEVPIATGGRFDELFLELPPEILITAMREHQKYFAVVDHQGKLMPCFIAVNNTRTKDMDLVAKGHQRVLRARLSDARFFYQADRQGNMDEWRKQLKGVLFQAQLGSMLDKVQRVESLGAYLASLSMPDLTSYVVRAAQLCKTDLVSQVVYEFANLQGIMGRTYAKEAGEPAEVSAAIEEHYRPTYSGGPLPQTKTGALLAVADKMDTICGCFSAGLIPTGASDPYALRRQGIGVVQILLANQFTFSLNQIIHEALRPFKPTNLQEIASAVYGFLQGRIANMLVEEGNARDVVAAVTCVTVDNVPNVWQRVQALQTLKGAPDFEPLAAAFKRVVNILRKSDLATTIMPDKVLFAEPAESALFDAFLTVKGNVNVHLAEGDLTAALRAIASLRNPIDRYFEDVMVMAEDDKLRNNRLALLQQIASLFNQIADFSKIAT